MALPRLELVLSPAGVAKPFPEPDAFNDRIRWSSAVFFIAFPRPFSVVFRNAFCLAEPFRSVLVSGAKPLSDPFRSVLVKGTSPPVARLIDPFRSVFVNGCKPESFVKDRLLLIPARPVRKIPSLDLDRFKCGLLPEAEVESLMGIFVCD